MPPRAGRGVAWEGPELAIRRAVVPLVVVALLLAYATNVASAARGQIGLSYNMTLQGAIEFPTSFGVVDGRIHLGIGDADELMTGLGVVYPLDGLMDPSVTTQELHLYVGGGFNLDVDPDDGGGELYLLMGLRYDLDPRLYTFVEATSYAGFAFGLGMGF